MSSLLTNTSAMVALQTLRKINYDLGKVQGEISTGKKIANAKDNASIWGITTTMQTDVSGFKAISESLSLGTATLGVARDGAETITSLLDQLKAKVVASQEENVDRTKIQADVEALRNQIVTVVDAAQFNGLNLLKGNPAQPEVSVLASLNRDADGNVTASHISFDHKSLENGTLAAILEATAGATFAADVTNTLGDATGDAANDFYTAGEVISLRLTNSAGQGVTLTYAITADDVADGATVDDLATAAVGDATTEGTLIYQLTQADTDGLFDATGITIAADANTITFETDDTTTVDTSALGSTGGGLAALATLDVTTDEGAAAALDAMEEMIQTTIDAAASFGSAQGRIQTQGEYVSEIIDGLSSGVGALVDADMEAASARLQALQVQQQLGVQALSIANQQPQNILALFRQ